jgi:hypothetical protein
MPEVWVSMALARRNAKAAKLVSMAYAAKALPEMSINVSNGHLTRRWSGP